MIKQRQVQLNLKLPLRIVVLPQKVIAYLVIKDCSFQVNKIKINNIIVIKRILIRGNNRYLKIYHIYCVKILRQMKQKVNQIICHCWQQAIQNKKENNLHSNWKILILVK